MYNLQHVLDVTRFVSRVGSGYDTGIDRAERAAITDSLSRFESPYYLCKIGRKFAILDRLGITKFLGFESTGTWPKPKGIDKFRLRLSLHQRCVRTALKSVSLVICSGDFGLKLNEIVGDDFTYLNFGHSNLSNETFDTLRQSGCSQSVILIHDMIPLDHPEFCRSDTLLNFKEKMRAVSRWADHAVCNSIFTQERAIIHFQNFGRQPNTSVSYLGLDIKNDASVRPMTINDKPNFLVLGTIEPRKNIGLLIDVWEQLEKQLGSDETPNLLIVGRRGWESQDFFNRLDILKNTKPYIFEFNKFNDDEVQAAIRGSTALLFPSFAEGYGLPAQESIALGVPVICSDIPVFQELLPSNTILIDPKNQSEWVESIKNVAQSDVWVNDAPIKPTEIRTWDDFFTDMYINIKNSD